ncbi:hypothetical protein HME9302_02574 [Alteripontixanthobacter maritimus]|uniref:Uncharacterized protein n=2 Tax=Alteripontixanthobacter maritimus TaxID=2161824 RepID=A0A369QA62_9SPHN|nr:hypothetical protein HME9302_02574 [Alteripontixanthobacter maritimus]
MEQKPTTTAGTDLEQLAHQLDRTLSQLDQTERRFADLQITPGETTFRDPKNAYHQITIGAVLTARGLSAHEARALDGLLSMTFEEVVALIQDMPDEDPAEEDDDSETIADGLIAILSRHATALENRGRYADWRRSFDRYRTTTDRLLSDMTEEDLEKLSKRPPTRKQLSLIRTTCTQLRLEFPTLANRADAFRWLRDVGANTRYRERR